MLHISLAAETITKIGNFSITNSLVTTWIVMIFLISISVLVTKNLQNKPNGIQSIIELLIGGLHDFFNGLVGKHASRLFPLVASYFLLILFSNWFGLLPGVGTIGLFETEQQHENTVETVNHINTTDHVPLEADIHHSESENVPVSDHEATKEAVVQKHEAPEEHKKFIPLFRAPTADLNMTLALALIAFFIIQYFGFSIVGPAYAKKFINFSNPIFFFVGILEIISDISKIISFAFRLFGNIFAGEVLLAVFAFLLPFIVPIPFLGMEIFVGFIQALVFSMLVAVFVNIAAAHAEHGGSDH